MVDELEPGLRRIRAANASPMTADGTNTYILGTDGAAVIDPGPDDDTHLEAILRAAPGLRTILVTHAHRDHTALVPRLKAETGARVLAFGGALAGRSERMRALDDPGGGEGLDGEFEPDLRLADGDRVDGPGWSLTALHTPGHAASHLCFDWGGRLFSGDLAMGWASTLISPPDGDLSAFMASIARIRALAPVRLYPGHGDPVEDAPARLAWLVDHRAGRTLALIAALGPEPQTVATLARRLYSDTPPALMPAAERNIFAHLVDLVDRNLAEAIPRLAPASSFRSR